VTSIEDYPIPTAFAFQCIKRKLNLVVEQLEAVPA